jgi:hypothetical protein
MSAALERVDPRVELSRARAALESLQAADLSGLSDDGLLDYTRELERLRRQLAPLDHAVVLEIEARDLPGRNFIRSTGQFLRGLLRLDPREAHARVAAAQAGGVRRAMTGAPLPPIYAEVATAQAAGEISERHARLIVATVEKLPTRCRPSGASRSRPNW